MEDWKPKRQEIFFAISCLIAWVAISLYMAPSLGGTDIYLFRDPACNFLAGHGFRTASFEHSHSFQPVLFSIYTPGSLWAFMLVAKVFGCGITVARIYPLLIALPPALIAFFGGLRFLKHGWLRWAFLALWAVVFPVGMNMATERPEAVSFLLLLLLVIVMRRQPGIWSCVLTGILGGMAALSQPFAGILAFLLISGWLITALIPDESPSTTVCASRATILSNAAVALFCFALPVALTAICFYSVDHQSLKRFLWEAKYGGVERSTTYSVSDLGTTPVKASTSWRDFLAKYKDLVMGLRSPHGFTYLATAAMLCICIYLLLKTKSRRARISLLIAGFGCFLFPIAMFPLEYKYIFLTCALFPALLALDWGKSRPALNRAFLVPVLFVMNFVCTLPMLAIYIIQMSESRPTYRHALQQADILKNYLQQHPLGQKVVLVPATHYYLYKDVAHNIYNPAYLSNSENPDEVGAVVNCYESTKIFAPGNLLLPDFVRSERWTEISAAKDSLEVSLLHYKVMSRNWGMECDIYVRSDN
jgi:hypothetical protein